MQHDDLPCVRKCLSLRSHSINSCSICCEECGLYTTIYPHQCTTTDVVSISELRLTDLLCGQRDLSAYGPGHQRSFRQVDPAEASLAQC